MGGLEISVTDKETAKEKLKELVEQFALASKNKDFINEKNEEWVKHNYLEPLLYDVLGWERKDIEKEARVLKGRADYILKIGNEEVLVIEAKKPSVSLSEGGKQAVSYAYHRKIKFAVLTNFKEVKVYHALSNIKEIDRNLLKFESGGVFRLSFEQFLENFDKLLLLSRNSFENGEINKLLSKKDERVAKLIDASILDDLLHIRELLSKDLKKLRMELTKEQIDEAVQVLVDRLIFMRSVEDRGLEERDFLLKIVQDYREGRTEKRLWETLKIKFKIFDKEYNSKLFSHSLLEEESKIFFDDESLQKVVRTLYYGAKDNQERYQFDEIPGDLLGAIYEQYLGTILQESDKRVKLEEGSGKRKKMGIYYTPSYIVDYIVKNTVGEYIKDKTIDEILDVRIVDPACGSGSFLIRAFVDVCRVVEEKLKRGEFGTSVTFDKYGGRLNLGQKAALLTNCIYGVDLDEKAVELAQLNLLLKILENEDANIPNKRLPNLLNNVKNGNSLIDDSSVAGDKAFKWEAQFPDVFRQGGFDVVVGNPPYGADLKEKDRNYLEEKFNLGNTDTAALFMSLSNRMLKSGGINGFIIPKPFVYSSNWKKVREELLDGLNEIVDCGKVWKEVKLEQVIYFYKKDSKEKCYSSGVRLGKTISEVGKIDKATFEEFGFLLNGLSSRELALGQKIRGAGAFLNDFVTNQRGAMFQKEVVSTKSDFKVLGGKQIGRYYIKENVKGYVSKKAIDDNKAYIKENSILVQRIVAHIENPKDHIEIIGSLSRELNLNDFTIVDTINQLSNTSKTSSEMLLAIINSQLISWYAYRFIFGKAIRTMQFDNPVTTRIPVPRNVDKKQEQKIVSLVEQMLALQKKLHEGKPSGNEKESLERQIKNVDWLIDQEVYALYGLTKEEIKVVEESLR